MDVVRLDMRIAKKTDPIERFELENYFYSKDLYWVMLAMSGIKVYSLIVMLIWLTNDNKKTRNYLVTAMFVNWVTSAMSFSFGIWAIYISPEVFFPRGISSGGKWFNFRVAFAGFFPTLIYMYFWCVARRFKEMGVKEDR